MPWNVTRSAQFLDVEPLKHSMGDEIKEHYVFDANSFVVDPSVRNVIPAGTPMTFSVTYPGRIVRYTSNSQGKIEGVLARSLEILVTGTPGNEPCALYTHSAVFSTPNLVSFTLFLSAYISSMPTCRFR